MKKEYDFKKMKGVRNPYAQALKKQITIRINSSTIEYFKVLSVKMGIPYQTLMDSYLTECAVKKRKLLMAWK